MNFCICLMALWKRNSLFFWCAMGTKKISSRMNKLNSKIKLFLFPFLRREKKSSSFIWRSWRMKGSHMYRVGLLPPFPCLSPDPPASPLARQCPPPSPSHQWFLFHSLLMARTACLRMPSRTAAHFRLTAWPRSWLVHLKVCLWIA